MLLIWSDEIFFPFRVWNPFLFSKTLSNIQTARCSLKLTSHSKWPQGLSNFYLPHQKWQTNTIAKCLVLIETEPLESQFFFFIYDKMSLKPDMITVHLKDFIFISTLYKIWHLSTTLELRFGWVCLILTNQITDRISKSHN